MKFREKQSDFITKTHNQNIKDRRLISMSGLKPKTVMQMIQHTYVSRGSYPTEGVFLGVDNDVAGHKFVDRFKNMVLDTKDGQQITFHNLIPNDLQIPKKHIPLYQDAAIKYNVNWKDIVAIHKAETNLSDTNEIANNFGYGKYFGKSLEVNEQPKQINLLSAIDNCARGLAEHFKSGRFNLMKTLDAPGINSIEINKMHKKVKAYSEKYNDLGFLPTNDITKDWNDKLKLDKNMRDKKISNKKELAAAIVR
ncbi:hypothetical protein [Cytobacillus purgationiresistens]|uniref:hypothetical protein n=1 Tax=Cytobacillus purgationiresistens TaxID=863449 RepID=UPI0027D8712A|nr:hypothetical protein [Cytobacillus purgationiresistens]